MSATNANAGTATVRFEELERDEEVRRYLPRYRFLQRQALWIVQKYGNPPKSGGQHQ